MQILFFLLRSGLYWCKLGMIFACQLVSTITRCVAKWSATAIVRHKSVLGLHRKGGNLTSTICQQPSQYHGFLCRYRTRKPSITIDNLESALLHADLRGELISAYLLLVGIFCNFGLPQSCNHSGEHAGSREAEGLQIRKLQKRETKSWKSEWLRLKLGRVFHWKSLRAMDEKFVGRRIAQ